MTTAEYNSCVHQYADRLFRFVVKNVRDEQLARDIVQDTFEKTWMKVREVNHSTARSYLFSAAYRNMIDTLRKENRTDRWEAHHESGLAHSDQYSDLKEVLDMALATLPQEQKAAIVLRDYEGYSYKEIGEITGLNESQVKVYIYRARKALQKYIGKPEALL